MTKDFKRRVSWIIFSIQTLLVLALTEVLIIVVIPTFSNYENLFASREKTQIRTDQVNQSVNNSSIAVFEVEAYWRRQAWPTGEYLENKLHSQYPTPNIFYEEIVVFDETSGSIPTDFPRYRVLHIWRDHTCANADGWETDHALDGSTTYKDVVTPKPNASANVYQAYTYASIYNEGPRVLRCTAREPESFATIDSSLEGPTKNEP